MARTLSLVVPSAGLTLGNLLGAIGRWTGEQTDSLYGVADLHALTMPHDPAQVRELTRQQAVTLVAAGLDPRRCILFVQSHVPAHLQLHWLLEATAYDGELRRMIQYKEKSARLPSVRAALLAYPVLMAADILLYDVATVPVGEDQTQHLELARNLATRFNNAYGKTFVVPKAATPAVGARVMDLQDPAAKMSTSAPPDAPGVIRLLDPPDLIRRKISRAVTDRGTEVCFDPDGRPGVSNLLSICAACSGTSPQRAACQVASYRELKDACTQAVLDRLRPIQQTYAELADDRGVIDQILATGAQAAQDVAAPTLARATAAIGLVPQPTAEPGSP